MDEIRLDFARRARIGVGEAVFCQGKSAAQLDAILRAGMDRGAAFLLTRLTPDQHAALPADLTAALDYDPISRTAFLGREDAPPPVGSVAIVTAGSTDVPMAREAARTLEFNGHDPSLIFDVGVAGLWRLLDRRDEIAEHDVVIAVAGMDAALPSVLGGLIGSAIIAVPTSTGYGVSRGGETALAACLASCAPGMTAVNIDNGYGAAVAALRILGGYARRA
jgi:NCAIR mutase (PurE)-related protein